MRRGKKGGEEGGGREESKTTSEREKEKEKSHERKKGKKGENTDKVRAQKFPCQTGNIKNCFVNFPDKIFKSCLGRIFFCAHVWPLHIGPPRSRTHGHALDPPPLPSFM